ncbi:FAD/NAD(P)-binding oxidoreductase family protein [Euphorbia peplus]|nr:FAD/NAD(P)-binding oxidoreductase family protein [Euphorbia peplus]
MGFSGFMKGFHGLHRSRAKFRINPYDSTSYFQTRALSHLNNVNAHHHSLLPVLVVGAGPVGLVLSILLTKLGVKCAILEKNNAFSDHPQAHFINNRSMEIFRKFDGLAEEIQRSQPPVDLWRKFIYCTSLTGPILGSVDHMQPQDFEKVVSPVSVAHFSQYKLTRLLLKKLEDLSFRVQTPESLRALGIGALRGGEILMGHECVSINATDQSVSVTASYTGEGKYLERNISCGMLVGADGAGSTVRKLLGIELTGEKDLQKLVSIHFFCRDLGQYLLNERPGMLFFIFNTEAIGVLVAHDLQQGEFILQVPFYPPQQSVSDFSPQICKKLILKLIGQELRDIEVMEIKPWVMHAEVAEKFVTCDNRIILAGDAAHRFPPAGGFGMNTGIQDVHNLAWKIASVMNGIAPSSVIHTYEVERKPIALFNTALSVQNFRAAMEVPSALGLDPSIAHSVHRAVSDGVGSILPSGLQRAILDGIFTIGRAQLSASLLNEDNPLGSSRLAKVRRIFEEGKSLQLQFPAEDLGFRYLHGALVPDNDSTKSVLEPPTGRRRDYIPSADPGSRLPHIDVRILSNTSSEGIISTLDLISGDKLEFLLIVAPLKDSYKLSHAMLKVAEEFKVSAKVCVLWSADSIDKFKQSSKAALAPWNNFIDVMEAKKNSDTSSWWRMYQMTEKGAILVRPDEHIAWRVKSVVEKDHVSEMRSVFSVILGVK